MASTKYDPGFYAGEVTDFMWSADDGSDDNMVACFQVKLDKYPEMPCWCYHKAYGTKQDGTPNVDKTRAIVEKLGGSWTDADTFNPVGQRVQVGIFHNVSPGGSRTYENCYIVFGGRRSSDERVVTSGLSKLTGKVLKDGLPF